MYLNYKLPEDVWWRKPSSNYTNDMRLEDIDLFVKEIKNFEKESEFNVALKPDLLDASDLYRKFFVLHSLLFEDKIKVDKTKSEAEMLDEIDAIICNIDDKSKMALKIRNFNTAVNEIFSEIFFPTFDPSKFTTTLAKDIHKMIGEEIIKDTGEYRKFECKPAQEHFYYLSADQIEEKMNELFEQMRNSLMENHDLESTIKIGAYFISRFLQIHPFSNGNGRVSKVLLSLVLLPKTLVPIAFSSKLFRKSDFLECIQQSEESYVPDTLATMILDSTLESLSELRVMLGITK